MRNNKVQICKEGKLIGPSREGGDLFDTAVGPTTDMFVYHGLPWMAKKAVEMGRYYGSEALRNPKLQKKAIDYALDKLIFSLQICSNCNAFSSISLIFYTLPLISYHHIDSFQHRAY